MNNVTIQTEYIRLDALLKLVGIADTGGMAKQMIQAGEVTVCGDVCLMRGKKIRAGDTVALTADPQTVWTVIVDANP